MKSKFTASIAGYIANDSKIEELNGKKYHTFAIAHNEQWKDAQGNDIERTTWVNCMLPHKENSKLGKLEKGVIVFCEGALKVTSYQSTETGEWRVSINLTVFDITIVGKPATRDPQPGQS